MTTARTLASYGSPKKNGRPVSNPQTDITQADWNRLVADAAALCGTPPKLRVQFVTTAANGAVTPAWFAAQWGVDSASAPAIARTGTGVYTVSTPAAWATPGTWVYTLDPAGSTQTTAQVIWTDSTAEIDGAVATTAAGWCRTSRTGYVITVYVYNSSWTLSDLGGVQIRLVGA